MVTTVNIHEAKTHLSRLIERVLAGEKVTIAKAGVPQIDLVPHRAVKIDLIFGSMADQVRFDDDAFDKADPEIDEMFASYR